MIGTKFIKGEFSDEAYSDAASWCNRTRQGTIEDKGDYYEVVALPVATLEELIDNKLSELRSWFEDVSANAVVQSSLGFPADADATADRNINGLLKAMSAGLIASPVLYRGADNEFHSVTAEQLGILQLEIITNGQQLYQQKWQLEQTIKQAQTKAELDDIVFPEIIGGQNE